MNALTILLYSQGENMNFMESVNTCFRKFTDFNGRASRSEFWWFMLFIVIANILLTFIPFIGLLVSIALLVPCLSAGSRRLHDINKPGWMTFIGLIPLIGLVMIYFYVQPSDGSNQYGPVSVAA